MARAASVQRPERDAIDQLDVSPTWKRRFRLIERAGGVAMKDFRDLAFGERMAVSVNLLAFLFGPIYYAIKGLWRPAVSYLVLVVALALLLDVLGLDRLARAVGYMAATVYALRANLNYYRKMVLRQTPWF
jgi:hypothetical protein